MKNPRAVGIALALAGVLAACSDSTGPNGSGNLTVNFDVLSVTPAAISGLSATEAAAAALAVDGDNGTLTIDDIWLVVDEFKLERVKDACEEVVDQNDDDDCEEFELPPFFVSVPLEGEGAGEIGADVPRGTYEELKFETKAPDDDGDDATLLKGIQDNHFEDWPAEASMLVVGTFTPADGVDPIPFRVYFDAEVKVELEFEEGEPLVIEEGGEYSVTVFIDPAIWFVNDDGTVDDLTAYDYDATGEVFKFEAKFEDGVTKIELDD